MNIIDCILLAVTIGTIIIYMVNSDRSLKREINLRNKWAEAEQECATWISMYQDELAENRILSKELEQYRNHQEEA